MLPRTRLADLPALLSSQVRVCGFIQAIRDQKRRKFVILRDASGLCQLVHEKDDGPLSRLLDTLTQGSTLCATGRVVAMPAVKLGGFEVVLDEVEVSSLAAPLPIAEDSGIEKLMDYRQVSLRSPPQQLAFAVQTTLEHAMREFWRAEGFTEIHSPKLMGMFSESGAEAFRVDYFDTHAFLAQSPQFYKQMAIAGGMERVFEIGPAFRAEPSFTSRHETEFTSIDLELAWIESHQDVIALEERWLVHALTAVRARHGEDIRALWGSELRVPTLPFPQLTVAEAHEILRARGFPPLSADDMDSESERRIAEYVAAETGHEFLFLTGYPAPARAFYHMRELDRPELTRGFDLLWRGLEVTTGAQREHRYERLRAQADERGYDLGRLDGYLETFRYGCPPHGGLGLGLGRLLMRILGASSIRDVIFLSRTPRRLSP